MKNAREIISENLVGEGLLSPLSLPGKLEKAWERIGGPFNDDFRIMRFTKGLLTLAGSNSLYLFHMKQMSDDIIRAFNRELKQDLVTGLRFSLTGQEQEQKPEQENMPDFQAYADALNIPPEVEARIEEIVSGNPDPQLREKIRSYLRSAYSYERFRDEGR